MGKKYVISLAGDTSMGNWYIENSGNEELMKRLRDRPESFFDGVRPIIDSSDHIILNLETVLEESPTIYFKEKKFPNWDSPAWTIKILKSIGVTAVSLANNHTMDFGYEVMLKTKRILEDNGIKVFGAGVNEQDALEPLKITLTGERSKKNIYILSGMRASRRYREEFNFFASNSSPGIGSLNIDRINQMVNKIRSEDSKALIILYPHWQGIDYQWASDSQAIREICSDLVKSGINYIIGHGPHMINNFERIGQGTIAYSIGNFVFNSNGRYQRMQAPPFSAIAKLYFEEDESDWKIRSRFYTIVTDNRYTNYQTRGINEPENENLTNILLKKHTEDEFPHFRDSVGFYISPHNNNSKPSGASTKHIDSDKFIYNVITSQKHNEYNEGKFSTHKLLAEEFEKRGCRSLDIGGYLVVDIGKDKAVFLETESTNTSLVGFRVCKNKDIARQFLLEAGLSVVSGRSFQLREKEKALDYALSLPASVVKPADGRKGKGITVGVRTGEEFEYAWESAISATKGKILIEEQFIGGTEARYLVVGGVCTAVVQRIPPNVVGNGIDTIEKLIEIKNEARSRNPNLCNKMLIIDKHRLSIIRRQGYDLSSIPDKNVHVTIDLKGGLSTGADSLDITDETHELYKKIAEKAATSIPGLDIIGVDILAHDHFKKPESNNYTIVELNTRPGIGGHHFPFYGKSRNVAGMIADYTIKKVLQK